MPKEKQNNYEQLLKQIVNKVTEEEHLTQDALEAWLTRANEYLQAAEEVSEDELEKMRKYLRRDLQTFAEEMHSDEESSIWLATIKDTLWHSLTDITDKTQVEWAELAEDLSHDGIYRAHEWVGLGILCCTGCGHEQEIYHATRLTRCIECGNETFHRKPFKP